MKNALNSIVLGQSWSGHDDEISGLMISLSEGTINGKSIDHGTEVAKLYPDDNDLF